VCVWRGKLKRRRRGIDDDRLKCVLHPVPVVAGSRGIGPTSCLSCFLDGF
jgi:hypothetical protein